MSHKIVTMVWSRRLGSGARKQVALCMAGHADEEGRGIRASKASIAAETELSRRTVFRVVAELIREGLIVEAGRQPCRNGFTVNYSLNLPAIAALPSCHGTGALQAGVTSWHRPGPDTGAIVAPDQCRDVTPTGDRPAAGQSRNPASDHDAGDAGGAGGNGGVFSPAPKSDAPTFSRQ